MNSVIFDMDGVIFDSERATYECWMRLADKYGIKNLDEAYRACIGTTYARTRKIMTEYYGEDFPYSEYAGEASSMFHSLYDGGRLPIKKGAVQLLKTLKDNGWSVALASSTREQTVKKELGEAGLLEFFDAVICGDMVTKSKPDPEIFLTACRALGAEPAACYVIEDSYNGIRAAHKGGMKALMVPDMLPATEEMGKLAFKIFADLEEVREYLVAGTKEEQ